MDTPCAASGGRRRCIIAIMLHVSQASLVLSLSLSLSLSLFLISAVLFSRSTFSSVSLRRLATFIFRERVAGAMRG